MIDYVLENNPLTKENLNDRRARVVNVHSYTEEDLAEAIAKRNMGISKPEALAMLAAATEIQMEWITSGNGINLRLAHFHPSIPGTFEEGEYPKEAIYRVTPSKEVAAAAKTITLRHVEPVSPIRIEFVNDVKSNTTNDRITGGGTVKILGHHLKIAGTGEFAVGVEFVSVDTGTVYTVPEQDLIINHPSEVMIIAPPMTSGEKVILKITTQYSGGTTLLKKPRSITLEKDLTVV
jgi:hypothetical protein